MLKSHDQQNTTLFISVILLLLKTSDGRIKSRLTIYKSICNKVTNVNNSIHLAFMSFCNLLWKLHIAVVLCPSTL